MCVESHDHCVPGMFAAGSEHSNAELIAHRSCAGLFSSFLQLMGLKCCLKLYVTNDVMCSGSADTLVASRMQEVLVWCWGSERETTLKVASRHPIRINLNTSGFRNFLTSVPRY